MTAISTTTLRPGLPKATIRDTLAVVADVILPTIANGPVIRRPRTVALAEWLDLDRRAVRRMQRIRDRYGSGPLLLRVLGRSQVVILAPEHVHRVLDGSPEPFAAASSEKRAALSHFEPGGVLISQGPNRADRRRFNEVVLDTSRPTHRLGARFSQVVREEMAGLVAEARRSGHLTWDTFTDAWFCMVRRVVFGDAARDDRALTDMLAALRSDANWASLRPKRTRLRRRFDDRLNGHLARAEPGSLAAEMAGALITQRTVPAQQVPQWLFAFDAAGIATFRALALLASHPEQARRAQGEIEVGEGHAPLVLPCLRACLLESVRLWPTTPMLLRQTTQATDWKTGVMPAGTSVLIFVPFFHRDDRRLAYADRFSPELWLEERSTADWPLVPFSGGPVTCPGQNLVLLLASTALASLLDGHRFALQGPTRLDARRPLPATLNHFALRFVFDG